MGWVVSHIPGRYAYKCDNGDYFETPADTSLNLRNSFSYGFMIKPGKRTNCFLASRLTSSGNPLNKAEAAWYIGVENHHLVVYLHASNSYPTIYFKSSLPVTNTNRIVDIEVVWDNASKTLQVYKNATPLGMILQYYSGSPYSSNTVGFPDMPELPGSVMRFGWGHSSLANFDGTVYDIRYFDIARTSEDIFDYYQNIKPTTQPANPGVIVFSSMRENGVWNLYSMDGNGNNTTGLYIAQANIRHPQFSRHDNAAHLVFTVHSFSGSASYVHPKGVTVSKADGTNPISIYNTEDPQQATWSGDGSFITTSVKNNTGSNQLDLYKITDPLGTPSAPTVFTGPAGVNFSETYSFISNDNSFIISINKEVNSAYREIIRRDLDPTTAEVLRQKVLYSSAAEIDLVVVSPDNNWIAFSRAVHNGVAPVSQVFLMNAKGGAIKQLTGFARPTHPSSFSPDSLQILFYTTTAAGNEQLHTMNLDGSNIKNISKNNFRDIEGTWKDE